MLIVQCSRLHSFMHLRNLPLVISRLSSDTTELEEYSILLSDIFTLLFGKAASCITNSNVLVAIFSTPCMCALSLLCLLHGTTYYFENFDLILKM